VWFLDTIITSFPQRYRTGERDPDDIDMTDVFKSIKENVSEITTRHELAAFIM